MSRIRNIILLMWMLIPVTATAGIYEDMMQAISIDDEKTVASLLQRGMDVNTVSPQGESLLTLAVKEGKLNVIKIILGFHPKINTRNAYGETALMLAALKGQNDVVKLLLGQGAEVNQP